MLPGAACARPIQQDRYDIIMVDNKSTDGSATIVAAIRDSTDVGARQSSYAARNRGIGEARGSVVAFIDSDCVPLRTGWNGVAETMTDSGVHVVQGSRRPAKGVVGPVDYWQITRPRERRTSSTVTCPSCITVTRTTWRCVEACSTRLVCFPKFTGGRRRSRAACRRAIRLWRHSIPTRHAYSASRADYDAHVVPQDVCLWQEFAEPTAGMLRFALEPGRTPGRVQVDGHWRPLFRRSAPFCSCCF